MEIVTAVLLVTIAYMLWSFGERIIHEIIDLKTTLADLLDK